MYLVCFGTRPEIIKCISLIKTFKFYNIPYKVLFSGQHPNLIESFYKYIDYPDFSFVDIMSHGQTLNQLCIKIMDQMDNVLNSNMFEYVIVQGDTTTAFTIALSAFHRNIKVIHLEAGLRTYNKYSPYPEELNRRMISQIADIHLCPTKCSADNLKKENIIRNIFVVGNTIVDIYKMVLSTTTSSTEIQTIIDSKKTYIVVTLHRRENRGHKMIEMWDQLNELSELYKFVYITHPSLPESKKILNMNNIALLDPIDYENMVHLLYNCTGIISDSGGLQEEAVCANKPILICRDTTERPETVACGLGKVIGTQIIDNIDCLLNKLKINDKENPYGSNVSEKIMNELNNFT